eukprot:TRINITY_DN50996_c0_g1_i1.p1 TRINITY_DN50996_c0_g1~~TRINITY_DN50996_c0_g1_i1.p1  ORF type:complete len:624 (-),score=76.99 TRINITY_DN50996_c0_g1_i1:344-2215(-)
MTLNGRWDVHISIAAEDKAEEMPQRFEDGQLVVPFPAESAAGGLGARISEFDALWLRRQVEIPAHWARTLLHVDACDWQCHVYVSGLLVGTHQGGYDPFVLDITDHLQGLPAAGSSRSAEIVIRSWDATDIGCEYLVLPPAHCQECCPTGWQARGKQSLVPGFIMYGAASGPWQTVWLEGVADRCMIDSAATELLNGADAVAGKPARLRITIRLQELLGPCALGTQLLAIVGLHGKEIVKGEGDGPLAVDVVIKEPRLWSPDDPVLYGALLALCPQGGDCGDTVEISFGLRWLSVSKGQPGSLQEQDLLFNGKRLFQHGVLYQAYWPESLISPPSLPAVVDELERIKAAGFNLVRVHAAVMPAVFYHLCDQMGLLVWQDFPAGDSRALPLWDAHRGKEEQSVTGLDEIVRTKQSAAAFWGELQAMVALLAAFTSVVCWVPFNEGWGQFETMKVVRWLRNFGGGRWINAASGWNDVADLYPDLDAGDLLDVHNYESPPYGSLVGTFTHWPLPIQGRALAVGEYGGLGLYVDGHEFAPESSWAYGNVSHNKEELAAGLLSLADRLQTLLCESRVSAAVYTQWNDVETEVNGLVTYDRVPKVSMEIMKQFASILHDAHARCGPDRA